MKKLLITLLFFGSAFVCATSPVAAHFLVNNKGTGVLIHLDPEDDPIVGQLAHIHLDFRNTQNKLTNSNCDCNVEILEDGVVLKTFKTNTLEGESHTYMVDYTFPKRGLYTLHIFGKGLNDEFPAFDMKYDLRVEREITQNEAKQSSQTGIYVGIGVFAILLIGVLIYPKIIKSI